MLQKNLNYKNHSKHDKCDEVLPQYKHYLQNYLKFLKHHPGDGNIHGRNV